MIPKAKRLARELVRKVGEQLPVDVYVIARACGVDVRQLPMEDSVSGVLVLKDGQAAIGVNEAHHPNRQRFSIAHELGHYLLHRNSSDLFVDAAPIFFRDDRSSDGTERQEIQANAFAAELLMPEDMLRAQLTNRPLDVFDDIAMRQLAVRFGVSVQALSIRLTRLGLITLE
jgi:Zn-dependent peptidase ImmA (M78 family)